MFVTDYGDYRKGISTNQAHASSVRIKDVEVLSKGSFRSVFGSGLNAHEYGPFDRENQLYITYRRDVFRAKRATAKLAISDWESDPSAGSGQADPGGPVGQELGFNFIQVQPYLED